jgi:tellurite resistance protein
VSDMSVNQEELKRMIDRIPEQDNLQVFDFIGYLSMKRENDDQYQLDFNSLSEDKDIIRQVQKSREDRKNGDIYNQELGL